MYLKVLDASSDSNTIRTYTKNFNWHLESDIGSDQVESSNVNVY